ncbi:hypothetical protein [Sciscionella marina]|uniref:hypothetical protein n=1 Tax=Sciscionella marina TaxID=508770 RepID=UPI001F099683|nr:hypothetical protein [Sciscionella marina]
MASNVLATVHTVLSFLLTWKESRTAHGSPLVYWNSTSTGIAVPSDNSMSKIAVSVIEELSITTRSRLSLLVSP